MTYKRALRIATYLPAALVALVLTFPQVSAAAADTALVPLKTKTPIAASQDRLVWSEYDANTKAYTLKSKVGSEVTSLPIATRTIPFDVDLGSDQSGNAVAVYSRCDSEPRTRDATWDLYLFYQEWDKASGCKVYQFDFQTNQESTLSLGRPGYSNVEPSIANGKVAYISFKDGRYSHGQRVYQQGPGGKAELQRTVGKTAKSTGCISYGLNQKEMAKCVRTATEAFRDLELSRNKLAIVALFNQANTLYHLEVGAGSKFKAVAYGSGALDIRGIASPQIAGNYVYFAQVCEGPECLESSKSQQVRRYSLGRKKLEYAAVRAIGNIAVAGSTLYYENSGPFDFSDRECEEGDPTAADCGIRQKQLTSLHFAPATDGPSRW